MRNMSFMLTTAQIRAQTKTVTRRLGWKNLQPGTLVQACVQCQGLRKGGKVEKLAVLRVIDVRREPLSRMQADPAYGRLESRLEGFPQMTGAQFVAMFVEHNRIDATTPVMRIEFEYVEEEG